MAVGPTSVEQIPGGGIMRITWDLTQGETGNDANYPAWADRNIQLSGTFDGATVAIQGSNTGTDWVVLTTMAGDSLGALATACVKMIQENTLHMRPVVTGGTGNTAITVTQIARRR